MRGVANDAVTMLESRSYAPYGDPLGVTGTNQTPYGFTGEPLDGNGLLYLRAQYYALELGVFTALDPFEGMADRPMSLNGYSYVEQNPVNWTDPSGACIDPITCGILILLGALGVVGLAGCSSQPTLTPELEQKIREATVVLTFGLYDEPKGCEPGKEDRCPILADSLGVLTSGGILTHDHYVQDATPAGSEGLGAQASYDFLTSLPGRIFMRILGAKGSQIVVTSNTQPESSAIGTLLLRVPDFDLAAIGNPISEIATYDLNQPLVYFAYIPGENTGNLRHDAVVVGTGDVDVSGTFVGQRGFQIIRVIPRDVAYASSGDSGGPMFYPDGKLVGIRQGITDVHEQYFAPLSGAKVPVSGRK